MSRLSTLAIATLLCSFGGLAACGPRAAQDTAAKGKIAPSVETSRPSQTAAVSSEPATSALATQGDVAVTPRAGDASVTVPEMAPTGGMAPAVDPDNPTRRLPGKAAEMAPTGGERAPYLEPSPR